MPSRSICRIDKVLEIVSDPWTLGILHELCLGPRRTLELHGAFTGMSTKTLSARLRKLTRLGIIARTSYPSAPPKVEYSLTDRGNDLLRVLDAISDVASRWDSDDEGEPPGISCRACGASGEVRAAPKPAAVPSENRAEPAVTPVPARKRTDVTLL